MQDNVARLFVTSLCVLSRPDQSVCAVTLVRQGFRGLRILGQVAVVNQSRVTPYVFIYDSDTTNTSQIATKHSRYVQ